MTIIPKIYNRLTASLNKQKLFAVLIDPDKQTNDGLSLLIESSNKCEVDFFLLGGSLISTALDKIIDTIRQNSSIPVILFPGSLLQISEKADAILLLSLISGRNPDFLIGHQVIAAPLLKRSRLEVLPTGYILIDGGKMSSVEYISNTKPIPSDKVDIVVATAIAGEMLGKKLIYLEAGSGAIKPVSAQIISKVKENISAPLIAGGGLTTASQIKKICMAGADIIVVGTAIEHDINRLKEFSDIIHRH
ncbi:MAG: geranylgeranylglyceryl/heptaprenylglyceryl phosphate synthase [Bacteroidia bacterium]|nr:geranylgeranylglyceryl/heptaprenylglyceryl phosphate synthase [Bacteroidia bacterium]